MTIESWIGPPYTPKKVAGVTAAIAGLLTAGTLIANALNLMEHSWVATRGFVRSEIKLTNTALSEATTRQIGIEIRIEQAERRRIRDKIDDLQLRLKENPQSPEPLVRAIEDQIRERREELENKDGVIMDLRRLQRKSP